MSSPEAPDLSWANLPGVRRAWDDLADRLGAPPHLRAGWFDAWHGAFGGGQLRVLCLTRSGKLTGVLPLLSRRGVNRSPTNWHTPEFALLCETREGEEALVAGALRASALLMDLAFVDEATVSLVSAVAARLGQRVSTRVIEASPYICLEEPVEAYVGRLPRGVRSELRRRRARLAEQGRVTLEVYERADEPLFSDFLAVEGSGWKTRRGTAVATDLPAAAFYRRLADWASDEGWLRLALLRVGDKVIAADLALESADAHYLLKTGYDEAYHSYGPGKLMRFEMVSRTFARPGMSSYEFLGAADAWKVEWTDRVRTRMRVQVFGRSAGGRVVETLYVGGRRMARGLIDLARDPRKSGRTVGGR